MTQGPPLRILVLTLLFPAAAGKCLSRLSCELNGRCASDGACICDPGWTGPTCGMLDLLPAAKLSGPLWPENRNASAIAWGASIIEGIVEDDLFVDTCCYNPTTILHDVGGCQIVHARAAHMASDFRFTDVAVGPNRFNPHAKRLANGSIVLFHAGSRQDCPHTCTGDASMDTLQSFPHSGNCTGTGISGINIAWSPSGSPSGPWSSVDELIITGGGSMSNPNPSVLFDEDTGKVLMSFTMFIGSGSHVGLATAESFLGPYMKLGPAGVPIFPQQCEDGFLFRNPADGSYHLLCHDMLHIYRNWTGVHAYSVSGEPDSWHVSYGNGSIGAYSCNVDWDDGSQTRFFRRERPELHFHADGTPAYLVTGVEYEADDPGKSDNHQYSFALRQYIRRHVESTSIHV